MTYESMERSGEFRWKVVKAMFDDFPELRRKARAYLENQEINLLKVVPKQEQSHNRQRLKHMAKRVIIEFSLVEESAKKVNQEIVDEIFSALFEAVAEGRIVIPWCKKVEKVAIVEDN